MAAGRMTRKPRKVSVEDRLSRFEDKLLENLAENCAEVARESLGPPGPQPPSLPGETPNNQTGELKEGITVLTAPDGHVALVLSERVEGDPRVPRWLEEGTPGGQMEPRPYMSPAYERTRAEYARIVAETKAELT